MQRLRQFREEGFIPHVSRLSEETYGQVLDNIVVTCVDCVVACGDLMLLGRRRQEPYPDWWVSGGRMHPGERFEETAQRVLRRELGLTTPSTDRFHYISTISYVWRKREQPPAGHGCHMVGVNYALKISEQERCQITGVQDFTTLHWVHLRDVYLNDDYHPAIRGFAEFLLPKTH